MLLGELDLNAAPAVSALDKVDTKFAGTTSSLSRLGASLGPLVASFLTLSAVATGFSNALDLGGKLQDLSNSTGESVGDLVILRQAFENAGLGADNAGDFLLKFQDSIAGVNEDGKSTAGALDALGVSAGALRDLPALEQLELLSAGFQKLDQTSRVAAARDLFGKSGGKALSLFNDDGGLGLAREQAAPLAAIMGKNVAAFDALGDSINGLKLNFSEFFAGALEKVAPELQRISDTLGAMDLSGMGARFGEIAVTLLDVAASVVKVTQELGNLAPLLLGIIGGVSGARLGPVGAFLGALGGAGLGYVLGGDTKADATGGAPDSSAPGRRSLGDFGRQGGFSSSTDFQFSSRTRAGGGGFNFGIGTGSDPHLTESRRQTVVLENIHRALTGGGFRGANLEPSRVPV